MCVLGKRLLKDIPLENCTKEDSFLRDIYCPDGKCEEYYLGKIPSYMQSVSYRNYNALSSIANNVTKVKGIKGLASGVFYDNIFPSFLEKGQFISYGKSAIDIENTSGESYNQIMADITTSFTLLIGIFFPSVTG